jgi:hypothetical protein
MFLLPCAFVFGNDVFWAKRGPLWLGRREWTLFARFFYLASSGLAGTSDGDNKEKDGSQKAQSDGYGG